jgi:hypothetical protein
VKTLEIFEKLWFFVVSFFEVGTGTAQRHQWTSEDASTCSNSINSTCRGSRENFNGTQNLFVFQHGNLISSVFCLHPQRFNERHSTSQQEQHDK